MGIKTVSKKIDLLKKDFNIAKLFPVNSLSSAFAIFLFNENRIIEMNTINGKYKLANELGDSTKPRFSISTNNKDAKIIANLFTKLIKYFSCIKLKLNNWPIFIFFDARLNPNQFEMTKVDAIINAQVLNKVLQRPKIEIIPRPSKIRKSPKSGNKK